METLLRRLEAVIYADISGDWETASNIEEMPARWSASANLILAAQKAARVSRNLKIPKPTYTSEDDSEEELSKNQKRKLRRKRAEGAKSQPDNTFQDGARRLQNSTIHVRAHK